MACILTSGIALGCKDNTGGIKRVLIANKAEIVSVTPLINASGTSTITAITTGTTGFFSFVPNKMSSNWVENGQSNVQNGTSGFEQVLTLIFGRNETAKRDQVRLLAQADLVAIVEDKNGNYFILGEENGLDMVGNSASGTALGDLNGWTLTFTGNEKYPARQITTAIAAALKAS